METRVAIIGIIVENPDSVSQINDILHEVRDYVVGRMGIPYRERNISIISVVVDAPESLISSVSGKIGMLDGVSAKITYSRLTNGI
ncbi:MAG: iron-only hydrogenase system regulator [Eubacteriales bacterium]|jgi:putative iron-only hydrogenase system regulator|nr:iron-only hydrogenase system regulator [Oscillospiraceae bacterium]MBQ1247066.1 iron-only hydrogenase system regulator [Clostridiales bacterium]MDO4422274.1 iron-only hydrogenase system regulator [Eubacteriales bacterium]MBQ1292736.1 iron-only hydrogenase system regulator [Clostridiales bacterium]MBQ1570405.1 iron-only hydrogenase system regulator [Clostridiales bacterium]